MAKRKPKRKDVDTPEKIVAHFEKQDAEKADADDNIRQILSQIPMDIGTLTERKVLAVKMLPESRTWSITEKCRRAGVHRSMWYTVHGKEGFAQKCIDTTIRFKGNHAPEIFSSFVTNAELGGKDGLGDTRAQIAYLEDVGVHEKVKQGDINVTVAVIEKERKSKIKTGLERFGYTTGSDN